MAKTSLVGALDSAARRGRSAPAGGASAGGDSGGLWSSEYWGGNGNSQGSALANFESPVETAQHEGGEGEVSPRQVELRSARGDRVADLFAKLAEMGARHSVLETWGKEQRVYRFRCEVSLGGGGNRTRHFEAQKNDPLSAVLEVYRAVKAWKEAADR